MKHEPRWQYDCKRCKFSWNCGYLCMCSLRYRAKPLPEPPLQVRRNVNQALISAGYEPEFDL